MVVLAESQVEKVMLRNKFFTLIIPTFCLAYILCGCAHTVKKEFGFQFSEPGFQYNEEITAISMEVIQDLQNNTIDQDESLFAEKERKVKAQTIWKHIIKQKGPYKSTLKYTTSNFTPRKR